MKLKFLILLLFPIALFGQSFTMRMGAKLNVSDTAGMLTAYLDALNNKQATLVSGTNIKTVNGSSLLGSGNISITSAVSWGSITGVLSTQSDLVIALGLKLDVTTAASTYQPLLGFTAVPDTRTVNGNALSANILTPYTIKVQALTSSPADAGTTYFGMLPKAPTTTANISKVYIRTAGTITAAEIYCYSGTAGTNESWSLYIRHNNITDYLIATVSASASERVFSNTGLSISVSAGDYIEIKSIQPTWATNPLTTIYGGYIKLN